jgi:hypothetical protein
MSKNIFFAVYLILALAPIQVLADETFRITYFYAHNPKVADLGLAEPKTKFNSTSGISFDNPDYEIGYGEQDQLQFNVRSTTLQNQIYGDLFLKQDLAIKPLKFNFWVKTPIIVNSDINSWQIWLEKPNLFNDDTSQRINFRAGAILLSGKFLLTEKTTRSHFSYDGDIALPIIGAKLTQQISTNFSASLDSNMTFIPYQDYKLFFLDSILKFNYRLNNYIVFSLGYRYFSIDANYEGNSRSIYFTNKQSTPCAFVSILF